jgi:Predicted membrane protein (DUF2178)
MSRTSRTSRAGRRISVPAIVLALVLGAAMCAAAVSSGRTALGLTFLGIMVAFSTFVALAGRHSDTVAMLGDDVHEERHVQLHQQAALYTLNILALVIVGGFIVSIARGGDGNPYAFLGFVGGVTYVVCLLVLNRIR